MSPKAQATKENIDKLDFMKIKSNAEDTGSIPRLGTKLPHVTEQLSPCVMTTGTHAPTTEPKSHN